LIAILDYGLGNINAFSNIYKSLGIESFHASKPKDLINASHIILPGVGAFDWAIERLSKSEMINALEKCVFEEKIPILGVCVGLQMFAKSSDEGGLEGLSWLDNAEIKHLQNLQNFKNKLPHMGWNNIEINHNEPLFRSLDNNSRFYFLHSYYFHQPDAANVISFCDYGGRFACAVKKENIYGVQFHPEKSHHNGIQLLENFANI